jgi:hypothetical protein
VTGFERNAIPAVASIRPTARPVIGLSVRKRGVRPAVVFALESLPAIRGVCQRFPVFAKACNGLDIAVENAKGAMRSGIGKDGRIWAVKMPAHYGYIKRTEAAGDHVDVYLGPHLKSPRVFVLDQHDADSGRFDDHKVMLGFGSARQAREVYHKCFSDGRGADRLGHMRELSVEAFKRWLERGDTTKPARAA